MKSEYIQANAIIERIVAPLGRRIDESQPYVDARLKDGSRVRESDLFIEGYEPELARILTERLPESAGSDVYEMLFVKTIESSGNFYVTPSGITYIYGRYEIGPYVIGIVHVEVPWEDLVGILK